MRSPFFNEKKEAEMKNLIQFLQKNYRDRIKLELSSYTDCTDCSKLLDELLTLIKDSPDYKNLTENEIHYLVSNMVLDDEGNRSLHVIAQYYWKNLDWFIRKLFALHADIQLENNAGETPYQIVNNERINPFSSGTFPPGNWHVKFEENPDLLHLRIRASLPKDLSMLKYFLRGYVHEAASVGSIEGLALLKVLYPNQWEDTLQWVKRHDPNGKNLNALGLAIQNKDNGITTAEFLLDNGFQFDQVEDANRIPISTIHFKGEEVTAYVDLMAYCILSTHIPKEFIQKLLPRFNFKEWVNRPCLTFNGQDVKFSYSGPYFPLAVACRYFTGEKKLDLIRNLMQLGARLDTAFLEKQDITLNKIISEYQGYIANGQTEKVLQFFKEYNTSFFQFLFKESKYASIHLLALSGHVETLEAIADQYPDVVNDEWNRRDETSLKQTPLHHAVQAGNLKMLQFLLEQEDVDVNAKDGNGKTALHYAAKAKKFSLEMVLLLLARKGVEVNEQDKEGNTPLHYAANRIGNVVVVAMLTDNGAKIDISNKKGKTPSDVGKGREILSNPFHEADNWLDVGGHFLDLDFEKQDSFFEVPEFFLKAAAENGSWKKFKIFGEKLIQKNGNNDLVRLYINISDYDSGKTLTSIVAENGSPMDLEWFIENGGERVSRAQKSHNLVTSSRAISSSLSDSEKLLHAAKIGDVALLKSIKEGIEDGAWNSLISSTVRENGADIDALSVAVESGQIEAVRFLLENGFRDLLEQYPHRHRIEIYILGGRYADLYSYCIYSPGVSDEMVECLFGKPLSELVNTRCVRFSGNNNDICYCPDAIGPRAPLILAMEFLSNINAINRLLKAGADVSVVDFRKRFSSEFSDHMNSLLHIYKSYLMKDAIKEILEFFEKYNATWFKKFVSVFYSMHFLAEYGSVGMLKAIADKYPDIVKSEWNRKDGDLMQTPLLYAASKGKLEMVQFLLEQEGVDVNAQDINGNTSLHYAAKNGNDILVAVLLDRGAKDNIKNTKGETPYNWGRGKGFLPNPIDSVNNWVASLKDYPLDYVILDIFFAAPGLFLKSAAKNGHWKYFQFLAKKLIEKNGDKDLVRRCINTPYKDGVRTLTAIAAQYGSQEDREWFIENGGVIALPTETSQDSVTSSSTASSPLSDRERLLQAVRSRDVSVLRSIKEGYSGQEWYSMISQPVRENNADVDALVFSVVNNHPETAKFLVENGYRDLSRANPIRQMLPISENTSGDIYSYCIYSPKVSLEMVESVFGKPLSELVKTPCLSFSGKKVFYKPDDPASRNPLYLAQAFLSDSASIDRLLTAGADPLEWQNGNAWEDIGELSPPFMTHMNKKVAEYESLLETGNTPLLLKFFEDYSPTWFQLRLGYGLFSVHVIAKNRYVVVLKAIADKYPDIVRDEWKREDGASLKQTPLHHAVLSGNLKMVQFLLTQEGVDVNAQDALGNTPLHYAAKKVQNELIVAALLEKGAKDDIPNHDGKTPNDFGTGRGYLPNPISKVNTYVAQLSRDSSYASSENMATVIDGLKIFFAAPELFLRAAAKNGAWKGFKYLGALIQNNKNEGRVRRCINIVGNAGETLISVVSREGSNDHLSWFIEHGANVNFSEESGKSPLDIAIDRSNTEPDVARDMIELLLIKGAVPSKENMEKSLSVCEKAQLICDVVNQSNSLIHSLEGIEERSKSEEKRLEEAKEFQANNKIPQIDLNSSEDVLDHEEALALMQNPVKLLERLRDEIMVLNLNDPEVLVKIAAAAQQGNTETLIEIKNRYTFEEWEAISTTVRIDLPTTSPHRADLRSYALLSANLPIEFAEEHIFSGSLTEVVNKKCLYMPGHDLILFSSSDGKFSPLRFACLYSGGRQRQAMIKRLLQAGADLMKEMTEHNLIRDLASTYQTYVQRSDTDNSLDFLRNYGSVFFKLAFPGSEDSPSVGSSIHILASLGDVKTLQAVLDEFPDVVQNELNRKDVMKQRSPLHHAVLHDRLKMVKFLLEQPGIIVDLQDENGNTALHFAANKRYAAQKSNVDIVKALLAKGANRKISNTVGTTPEALGQSNAGQNPFEVIETEERSAVAKAVKLNPETQEKAGVVLNLLNMLIELELGAEQFEKLFGPQKETIYSIEVESLRTELGIRHITLPKNLTTSSIVNDSTLRTLLDKEKEVLESLLEKHGEQLKKHNRLRDSLKKLSLRNLFTRFNALISPVNHIKALRDNVVTLDPLGEIYLKKTLSIFRQYNDNIDAKLMSPLIPRDEKRNVILMFDINSYEYDKVTYERHLGFKSDIEALERGVGELQKEVEAIADQVFVKQIELYRTISPKITEFVRLSKGNNLSQVRNASEVQQAIKGLQDLSHFSDVNFTSPEDYGDFIKQLNAYHVDLATLQKHLSKVNKQLGKQVDDDVTVSETTPESETMSEEMVAVKRIEAAVNRLNNAIVLVNKNLKQGGQLTTNIVDQIETIRSAVGASSNILVLWALGKEASTSTELKTIRFDSKRCYQYSSEVFPSIEKSINEAIEMLADIPEKLQEVQLLQATLKIICSDIKEKLNLDDDVREESQQDQLLEMASVVSSKKSSLPTNEDFDHIVLYVKEVLSPDCLDLRGIDQIGQLEETKQQAQGHLIFIEEKLSSQSQQFNK